MLFQSRTDLDAGLQKHDAPTNSVMPARNRSKNGVAPLAYVPGIRVWRLRRKKDVDGRDKPGHGAYDEWATSVESGRDSTS
jgi:hypothetical protein